MPIQLIKPTVNIDFVGYRKIAYILTSLVMLIGIFAIVMNKGLSYGVDFAGGVMVQIEFKNPVSDDEVKSALKDIEMPGLIVQKIDDDNNHYLLRFSASESGHKNLRQDLNKTLQESFSDNQVEITRLEMVGPKVGSELRDMAVEAVFYSILLITVYISGRFEHNWFTAAGIAVLFMGESSLFWISFQRNSTLFFSIRCTPFASPLWSRSFYRGRRNSIIHWVRCFPLSTTCL